MNLVELLKEMNVLCRDNGVVFTDTRRLEVIEEKLLGSLYSCVRGNLFRLYSKKPLAEMEGKLLLVSSHVDCEARITECFSREESLELLLGTYDNSITNTAILSLMMEGSLPEQVVIAFTGDEEEDTQGATDVIRHLRRMGKKCRAMVLDVTDYGWVEGADFTIENNFWKRKIGEKVCGLAERSGYPWLFVPRNPEKIPDYVPKSRAYGREAEPDESWEYDEQDIKVFSLCIPVDGPMHSNQGTLARKRSFVHYVEVLKSLCIALAKAEKGGDKCPY